MRRFALASLILVAAVGTATANGRPPGTATITFRQGHEADIVAGMTFGMVVTHDGGTTWHWMCEEAVGYGGTYDPDYTYSASGAIFATTFEGLVVNRDGCTFDETPLLAKFSSSNELGPTAGLHVAIADPNDAKIYRSDDDGLTFPASANPGMINDWWQSLVIAPSDANRVYVAGYRFVPAPGPDAGNVREYTLLKSVDKGETFTPMSLVGFVTSSDSVMEIAGVSPTDPDLVFARVTFVKGVIGDAIYRSTNGGASWTKVIEAPDSLAAFVVRKNGQVIAGTPTHGQPELGTWVSDNCRATEPCTTWTPVPTSPHLSCLHENAAEEVWGCTQNFGANQQPGDGFGIMKSTDLATWTGVLKFQDIQAPIVCPAGTVQKDKCEATLWCGIVAQLGITSKEVYCAPVFYDGAPDANGSGSGSDKPGCCETGTGTGAVPGVALLGILLAIAIARPRSRRPR